MQNNRIAVLLTSTRTRGLATAFGAAALAVAVVGPGQVARADSTTDHFLDLLNNAGVGYSDPGIASSLGSSICTLLKEPGGNFARVASTVGATEGISSDTAEMFTTIAISLYCPTMLASVADGDWLGQLGLPGL